MRAWIRSKVGTVDEEGWRIKTKHFSYHPHSYGIATLSRVGFRTSDGGYQLMLHHFRPHAEKDFHDHPWDFRTLVLWGGYTDESLAGTDHVVVEHMRPGMTRKRFATHAHRTFSRRGAVTLVFTWPKSRTWCKGHPEHWVCGGKVEDFDATRGMVKVRA